MDAAAILGLLTKVIGVGAAAIKAGKDVAPYAQKLYDVLFNKKDVTQAELDALEADIDKMHGELQAEIPPEEEEGTAVG